MYVCICEYKQRAYMYVCLSLCILLVKRINVHFWFKFSYFRFIPAFYTYIYTYKQTYEKSLIHNDLIYDIHSYTYIWIHTYIHTYIHTNVLSCTCLGKYIITWDTSKLYSIGYVWIALINIKINNYSVWKCYLCTKKIFKVLLSYRYHWFVYTYIYIHTYLIYIHTYLKLEVCLTNTVFFNSAKSLTSWVFNDMYVRYSFIHFIYIHTGSKILWVYVYPWIYIYIHKHIYLILWFLLNIQSKQSKSKILNHIHTIDNHQIQIEMYTYQYVCMYVCIHHAWYSVQFLHLEF